MTDELADRREQRAAADVTWEWSAVRAYAREFAAEVLHVVAKELEKEPVSYLSTNGMLLAAARCRSKAGELFPPGGG